MDLDELKKFMTANNLRLDVGKVWENEEETAYEWRGYLGDTRIFDCNEWYVRKSVKLDVFNSDLLELARLINHVDWIYDLFINCEGSYPLSEHMGRDFQFTRLEETEQKTGMH